MLTASFGTAVLCGEGRRLPVVRDVHEAWPTITPAIALWLVFAGLALTALSGGAETLGALSRTLRLRLPTHALVVAAAAAATVLATCVAVRQSGQERERRHAAAVELAVHALRATSAVPLDRLRDVAATVRRPQALRRGEFDSLAQRLLRQPAVASVALARLRTQPPTRPTATEAPARPGGVGIVYAAYRADARANFQALKESEVHAALQVAVRSGHTSATQALRPAEATSPVIVAVVPLRRPRVGGSRGAFLVTFPIDRVRREVARRLPSTVHFTLVAGEPGPVRIHGATVRRDGGGDGAWTVTVQRRAPSLGLALTTMLVGGLLTILIGVLGTQSARRERHARALVDVRRAERDHAESARSAAEARSRVLAETSTDLICVLGPAGIIHYVSPACRDLLGYEPEELVGRGFLELVHAEDEAAVRTLIGEAPAGAGPVSITHRLRRRAGAHVWVEARVRLVCDAATGAVVEAHTTVRDVEDRMRAQAALTEAEEHFRSAFEEAPIGMALTSPDMRFLRVNRALCAITGYPRQQLEGLPVSSITHPDDLKADWEARGAMLEGELSSYRGERRYLHAAGSSVWVLINSTLVRDASGAPLHFLSQMQDITERRRHEAELRHMADHDPLTGLLNRRSFERELERHVTRVERYGATGAAIVLDLDHFKTINDTLGHSAGDQLIVRVAYALRTRLRESDVLARLGGDEFAILLPEASPEEAEMVAGAVLEAVRTQTVPTATGRTRTVTASLGVALFSDERRLTGEELLVNADLAMYDAKEAGRDQVAAYATAGHPEVKLQARMSWADLIRDALAEDRFVLHAQPIVDLATGQATQHELLLRMRAADGELIGPSAFLPVAERFDLMPAIDRWVAANAIRMVGAERRRGRELTVEVNISGGSTGDPELLALIERELRAADVDPAQIIFEITETIAVSNIPRAQHFAGRLAELGCRFALDDFGAGFGSFYYLKHLPFDYLKIDGEFVRHSAVDKTDQLVIQAVVDIARGLGKHTIAEHVGDAETAALLRRMGVEYAQGFHLGAPAPLEDWLPDAKAVALPSC
ncbi:MAG TPA: EAL domain-containing protein [Solirubrobacteraceae bacterium]|nr:EAL domain-containing protein [Solirubrobacteraceae bacterium]